ncbi:MAG: IS3 family transposase [Solirubrobacteraceae bacterium]
MQEREILKKAAVSSPSRPISKDVLSADRGEKTQHPVSLLCQVLGVSRAGYYAWKTRPASQRQVRDGELLERIREDSWREQGHGGWPRVHAELRHRGVRQLQRVARLMRQHGLSGMVKRRRRGTTVSVPGIQTAPDLVRRDFDPDAPTGCGSPI